MAKTSAHLGFSGSERLVVLAGKEGFLRAEYTETLRDALAGTHGETEIFYFNGETCELADVLDELRSYGLIQSYKLVVLDAVAEFLARNDGAYRKPIERYAENPVDHATLLMRGDTWRKSKLDTLIEAHGQIVKCAELKDAAAVAWCSKRATAEYGVTIDRAASNLLVERLGTSLMRLDSELAKLAARIPAGEAVSREHVVEMVGLSREEKAWEIQEAVISGNPGYALRRFNQLKDVSGAPDELMVWSLTDLCRKLHLASRMLGQGLPAGVVTRELRLWGAGGDRMIEVARRTGPDTLAQMLHRCIRLNAQRKTGLASKWRSLECLTADLADTLA